jgi:malate/lactate dehydrogenase
VAAFLNQTPSDEQLDKITEHLRFDNFEKNESVNNEIGKKLGWMNEDGKFIRKGNPNNFIKIFIHEIQF